MVIESRKLSNRKRNALLLLPTVDSVAVATADGLMMLLVIFRCDGVEAYVVCFFSKISYRGSFAEGSSGV